MLPLVAETEAEPAEAAPEEAAPEEAAPAEAEPGSASKVSSKSKSGKEKKEKKDKDKKEKKDKPDKKEKKEKEKKEKKEKKRKAEDEPEAEGEAQGDIASAPGSVALEAAREAQEADNADEADLFAGLFDPVEGEEQPEDNLFQEFEPDKHLSEGHVSESAADDDFINQVFGDMGEFAAQDDTAHLVKVTHVPGRGRKQPRPEKAVKKIDRAQEEWPDGFAAKFTKVLDFIKPMKALLIKEEDSHPYIQQVVIDMMQAADVDEEEFKKGLPMIKKMAMLPKALAIMKKHAFAEIFVTFDGCQALAKWLRCLPDGQLPNEHLRTELLTAMVRLPITKEALSNCKDTPLGAVVKNLQLNPRETISNRKIAGQLVQKWLKQVLTQKSEALDDEEEEENEPKATLNRPPPETDETLRCLEAEAAKHFRAAVPVIEGKDYQVRPLPRAQPVRRDKVALDTNRGKIGEVLKIMSRPNKAAWKPYSVSVAGRSVNAS